MADAKTGVDSWKLIVDPINLKRKMRKRQPSLTDAKMQGISGDMLPLGCLDSKLRMNRTGIPLAR